MGPGGGNFRHCDAVGTQAAGEDVDIDIVDPPPHVVVAGIILLDGDAGTRGGTCEVDFLQGVGVLGLVESRRLDEGGGVGGVGDVAHAEPAGAGAFGDTPEAHLEAADVVGELGQHHHVGLGGIAAEAHGVVTAVHTCHGVSDDDIGAAAAAHVVPAGDIVMAGGDTVALEALGPGQGGDDSAGGSGAGDDGHRGVVAAADAAQGDEVRGVGGEVVDGEAGVAGGEDFAVDGEGIFADTLDGIPVDIDILGVGAVDHDGIRTGAGVAHERNVVHSCRRVGAGAAVVGPHEDEAIGAFIGDVDGAVLGLPVGGASHLAAGQVGPAGGGDAGIAAGAGAAVGELVGHHGGGAGRKPGAEVVVAVLAGGLPVEAVGVLTGALEVEDADGVGDGG